MVKTTIDSNCSPPLPLGGVLVRKWQHRSIPRPVICDGFRVFCENVNSAARWRPRPEVTSPFDFPTPISYKWSVDNFRLPSSIQKLLTHFDFSSEIPFGAIFVKIAPLDWNFENFYFASYCACWAASIELLFLWIGCVVKSYGMEYFDWEISLEEFF